jgi:Helicase conserved C-terminal domain
MHTTILERWRASLFVRGWPPDLQPLPGTTRTQAPHHAPTLQAPLGHRARIRQQLLAGGHPFVDTLAAPPLSDHELPPCPSPPPTALRPWLHHGGRGITAGLTTAQRLDLLLAAVHHTRARSRVLVRDSGAAALWSALLRERAAGAAIEVSPIAAAAAAPQGPTAADLLVIVAPELLPAGALAAVLTNTACAHTLALADDAAHPQLLSWTSGCGPVLQLTQLAPGGTTVELHLPLLPAERAEHDAAWHTFLCGYDAYTALRPNAGFGTFVQTARRDPAFRPSLLAWHQALRIASWNEAKVAACADLLARHRGESVLVFTPDRGSAYRLAREHLIAPITSELPARERQQLLEDFRRGTLRCLCGPRLLDLGVPEGSAAVGIVVGGGFGPRHRLAQQRRVRAGGIVYELIAAETAEVGRALRFARQLTTIGGAPAAP